MNGTLEVNGDNTYKIPHMNKAKMEREGTLPRVLKVTLAANRHLAEWAAREAAEAAVAAAAMVPAPLPPLPGQHVAEVDVANGVI